MIPVLLFSFVISIASLYLLEEIKKIGGNRTMVSIGKVITEGLMGLSFGMLVGHTIKILVF